MRFVIIGAPRTGSSHLTEMLRAHPDILCHGEVFHRKNVWVYWPKRDLTEQVRSELYELRCSNPEALLSRVFSASYGRQCVGFKIFPGQCDVVLDKVIGDRSVRKVVLFRRNVLANFASAVAAGRTGSWSTKEDVGPTPKIPFRVERFVTFHDEYIAAYRVVINKLNDRCEAYHLVHYEDINDPVFYASLINFIGARPDSRSAPGRKQLRKQSSSDILSRFSNPEDVEEFLRRRRLLHWIHEAPPDIGPLRLMEDGAHSDFGAGQCTASGAQSS